MASETDIANRAMRLLKAGRIAALGDGSANANAANDVYDEVRDELLRSHNWNFAKRRAKLALSSTAPVSGFDNACPLPSGWIRTIRISDNDADAGPPPVYSEEESDGVGVIATDVDELWISYVYKVTDANRMTPDFRTALAYALALAIPGVSNLSAAREQTLQREADKKANRAKKSDAQGSTPDRRPIGSWAGSRGGRQHHHWPD